MTTNKARSTRKARPRKRGTASGGGESKFKKTKEAQIVERPGLRRRPI